MAQRPITSVFNDAYIAELFESYRRDPASVDESWRQFFKVAESLAGIVTPAPSGAIDPELLRKVAAAAALVDGIRQYGHLAVQLDPLGTPPVGAAELRPEFYGITEEDLKHTPAEPLRGAHLSAPDGDTAADVVARLRRMYSSTIGFEYGHIEEEAEREWLRQAIEGGELITALDIDKKKALLERLTEVDGLERFLGRAYLGVKRFSIEGTDVLVPMLDAAIERATDSGAREIVIGMAHRGRLNVLVHILGKSYETLFAEFEGERPEGQPESGTGDVKYHLGARHQRSLPSGDAVDVTLVPNPSHLEFVNPVLEGLARAAQRVPEAAPGTRDERLVLPVLIHGDAAFIGEGVVAETLNLSRLRGYRTGGTLHIIVNNQVGFTTNPADARSTYYSSDLAKGFEVPILHVNGDDAESCIAAVRLAIAYRETFGKDFLIDLVGYRRHGHNETDEPSFTQPTLYQRIKSHPTPREVFGSRLIEEGVLTADDVERMDRAVAERLATIHDELKAEVSEAHQREAAERERPSGEQPLVPGPLPTAVERDRLLALNEQLLAWPDGFNVHPRLAKTLERRRDALEREIDWGHAEALAFASLVQEGVDVRLTGQDSERGTFSHRQAVLHDAETGAVFVPLQHIESATGAFEIYNSPLSEIAVLAFEYGYSVAAPDALVLWEAQFGDFVNVAQPVIDQFLCADRAKWGQDSSVVLLLPHGYEGQGPEHSSARLERFLQLSAEGNMIVAYPSTPAQYFHILRRQVRSGMRRPLVLMQPKSLLRLREAMSGVTDLAEGAFAPVIDDAVASRARDQVRRLVLCTGKIYYDLASGRAAAKASAGGEGDSATEIALVRVEELYPWPHEAVARIVDLYPAIEEVVWSQEEPRNMGAWTYVAPRLRASTGNAMLVRYIGRPERASPAEGHHRAHAENQNRIISEVLSVPHKTGGKRKAAARA